MTANQTARPARSGRSTGPRLAAVLVVAASLPACAGENLFGGLATSDQGPRVEISAPTAGASVAAGDSVQVSAGITGNRGISQVKFSGAFTSSGGTALIEQTVTLANPSDTTLSRFMRRSGATTGNVNIIVEATDALGDKGADTVAVVLN